MVRNVVQKGQDHAEFFRLARDVRDSLKILDQSKRDAYRIYREYVWSRMKWQILTPVPAVGAASMIAIIGGAWMTGPMTGVIGTALAGITIASAYARFSIRRGAFPYSSKRSYGSEHAEFFNSQQDAAEELRQTLHKSDGVSKVPQGPLSLKQKMGAYYLMRNIAWLRKRIYKFEQKESDRYEGTAARRIKTKSFERLRKEFTYDSPKEMFLPALTSGVEKQLDQFQSLFPSTKGRHRKVKSRSR